MAGNALLPLAILACLAVGGILVFGLESFTKGGAFNRKNSNKIMQARIAAQFVAILLILAVVAFGRG